MPRMYEVPKVHYERADAGARLGDGLRMDVAGFAGIAQRGPLDRAVPIESWRQFEAWYGGTAGQGFLAYAVRGFFENGGERCWVVRAASGASTGGATASGRQLAGLTASEAPWLIEAWSEGSWGDELTFSMRMTHRHQTRSVPANSSADQVAVQQVSGFERGTLVRLRSVDAPAAGDTYRVLSGVDAAAGRLVWMEERPERRLRYDEPVPAATTVEYLVESVEYDLLVWERGRLVASYSGLSLIPEHFQYAPTVIEPRGLSEPELADRRTPAAPPFVRLVELRPNFVDATRPHRITEDDLVADAEGGLSGGTDGLARLKIDDFLGQESVHGGDRAREATGLEALFEVHEVSMVAVPDIHVQPRPLAPREPLAPCPPRPCVPGALVSVAVPVRPNPELPPIFNDDEVLRAQAYLVRRCEQQADRFAILCSPASIGVKDQDSLQDIRAWRTRFDTSYGGLFHPWIRVVDPERASLSPTRDVPPTGHVAGQLAKVAREVGAHRAAANLPLGWAQDTCLYVDELDHGMLNGWGINVIRPLGPRGVRILGTRTMSSDTSRRFLTTRRLLIQIRRTLEIGTQWVVFEPNDFRTRTKLLLSVIEFLATLWRRGSLVGETPDQGFRVQCDEHNNPESERANGHLHLDLLVAPTIPLEFVVVRVLRVGGELEISETDGRGGSAA